MTKPDYVFEVSFEVCNKVGGIYTVVSSKASHMVAAYGSGYCTVGFYEPTQARLEFDEDKPPQGMENAFKRLEGEGVKCLYGVWHVPGKPKAILVDASGSNYDLNDLKRRLWESYGIDSINSDSWFNDPLRWSYAVGRLFEELSKEEPFRKSNIVCHFHEWLSGFGMLYIKEKSLPIGTVFTTHATMLGRCISGRGDDLYKVVREGNDKGQHAPLDMAKYYGCEDKHTTEVACARNSDVFTTVSDVTAREAEYTIGIKPHLILYNGLDLSGYEEIEDLAFRRRENRKTMRGFLRSFFSRYYRVDYKNIRSAFISGRYEFHNKGLDVFIEALGRLNKRLRADKSDKNFVAFIFVPSGTRGENIEVLKNKALYEDISEQIDSEWPDIKDRLLDLVTSGVNPDGNIFSEEFSDKLRKLTSTFVGKRGSNPPLTAYELSYPENQDTVINSLKRNDLLNREKDRVKVVFYPVYLSPVDKLISLDYTNATLTCDVGVFPSFYEPWGYTPLETAAQGTLAITSDLAGFGQFIKGKGNGIQVLGMDGARYDDVVEELYLMLYDILYLDRRELTKRRMNAKELSSLADWKNLATNYLNAHEMALKRVRVV